jgi:hypothetical protein
VLVTSSFYYDRFEPFGDDPAQTADYRRAYDFYFKSAFQHPYLVTCH